MSIGFDSTIAPNQSLTLACENDELSSSASVDDLRLSPGSIASELFRKPWKFDFFQAVSMLQELASQNKDSASSPIGQFAQPNEEAVRFTVSHTTAFPSAPTAKIQWAAEERRASVEVNFIGLTGPSGILPEPYNDRLRDIARSAKHSDRNALRDWLDNFNHRLISLFYEAWTKYRFPIKTRRSLAKRADRKHEPAGIRIALAAIAGLGRSVIEDRDESNQSPKIDRDEWLGLAGILAQRPMNVANLTAALKQCLGVEVNIVQFQGCWLQIEEKTQCRLGVDNHQLGMNVVVGERIWNRQQRILVEVGPLSSSEFERFLPPSEMHAADGYLRLRELVEVFVGSALQFDIRPTLKIEGPIEVQLTAEQFGNRLGIDSWIGAPMETAVAADAVFAGRSDAAA